MKILASWCRSAVSVAGSERSRHLVVLSSSRRGRENCAMVISAEPVGGRRHQVVSSGIALLCLAVVLLDAGVDLLPDEPVVWIVTPVRLVLGVGLVAAVVGLGSPLRLWTVLDASVAGLVLASALATMAAGQDWSGWRAIVTAIAAYYLAVGGAQLVRVTRRDRASRAEQLRVRRRQRGAAGARR